MRRGALVASLLAAVPTLALMGAEEGPEPGTVRGSLRIEFSQPSDWRCASDHGCVVCVNIAGVPSPVVMHYADQTEPVRREIASGQSLEVCPGAPEDECARIWDANRDNDTSFVSVGVSLAPPALQAVVPPMPTSGPSKNPQLPSIRPPGGQCRGTCERHAEGQLAPAAPPCDNLPHSE